MSDTTVTTARFGTVITAVGTSKITDGILTGKKINIVHAAVGDGNGAYYMPTREQKSLKNECWRGEIAYARISESNPNMIDVKFIVPAEVGGFTIREAALLDSNGDTIAICNTPDAEKVSITDGVSFPLVMVVHILVEDAAAVSFTINPALDTVSREEMEKAIKAHNEDPNAHAGLLKFVIGDTEPEKGPALWFDTSAPEEAPEVLYLDIGPVDGNTTVFADIGGNEFAVDNFGVNTAPTEGKYGLEIIE